MATITANLPANGNEYLRTLSRRLFELASEIPETPTGGTNVLTIDNAPGSGQVLAFSITSGPASGKKRSN